MNISGTPVHYKVNGNCASTTPAVSAAATQSQPATVLLLSTTPQTTCTTKTPMATVSFHTELKFPSHLNASAFDLKVFTSAVAQTTKVDKGCVHVTSVSYHLSATYDLNMYVDNQQFVQAMGLMLTGLFDGPPSSVIDASVGGVVQDGKWLSANAMTYVSLSSQSSALIAQDRTSRNNSLARWLTMVMGKNFTVSVVKKPSLSIIKVETDVMYDESSPMVSHALAMQDALTGAINFAIKGNVTVAVTKVTVKLPPQVNGSSLPAAQGIFMPPARTSRTRRCFGGPPGMLLAVAAAALSRVSGQSPT